MILFLEIWLSIFSEVLCVSCVCLMASKINQYISPTVSNFLEDLLGWLETVYHLIVSQRTNYSFKKNYLFGCAGSKLQQAGSLVVVCGIF